MLHVFRQIAGLKIFSPIVVTQKRQGKWPGVPVEVVPRSGTRFLGRGLERWAGIPWQISPGEAGRMDRILQCSEARLLHIFFGNVAIRMLPLIRRVRVPVVISFHGADVTGSIATRAFEPVRREMFQRARLVMCRSRQLADKVAALGCDPGKLRMMRTVLPPIPRILHRPPTDGVWRIAQAARLVPKKGLAAALRAFSVFFCAHPLAEFTIAGEGPMEGELRRLAAELGIAERVTFRGFLDQSALADLCARSHIFLHPSETVGGDVEGIPNALLEAMASGLPSVATEHGGIPEVIRHGATGLLCREGDWQGLGEALLLLARDPELYAWIGQGGAEFVSGEFSAEKQIANVESLYREAMG
jgi:glycosyltransferase involved in cell wall biosynthesis